VDHLHRSLASPLKKRTGPRAPRQEARGPRHARGSWFWKPWRGGNRLARRERKVNDILERFDLGYAMRHCRRMGLRCGRIGQQIGHIRLSKLEGLQRIRQRASARWLERVGSPSLSPPRIVNSHRRSYDACSRITRRSRLPGRRARRGRDQCCHGRRARYAVQDPPTTSAAVRRRGGRACGC
jgi:hypothetical protein